MKAPRPAPEVPMRLSIAVVAVLLAASCNCGHGLVNDPDGGNPGGAADGGDAGTPPAGSDGGTDAGTDGGTTVACIQGATAITISPADSSATVSTSPAPISLTATALVSGVSQDVTSRLAWTASRDDDTSPGGFASPGQYSPEPGTGGTVTLRATDGCVAGQTTLTLHLNATFQDPGTAVTDRFNGPVVTGTAKAPVIVYPSDQTRFPRNIYKVLFQWKGGGNDYYRLTFAGPNSTTVVYSDGLQGECANDATAGCYEADLATWTAIAGANAGATGTLTIDGVTASDSNVYRSASIQLGFSKRDVRGAIFYWSTTAQGVRRASVSDAAPEAYVVGKPTATVLDGGAGSVTCVACHTVSRSGAKMVAFTQAAQTGEFVYDVTLSPPPDVALTTQLSIKKGFGTFRPDDARVAVTNGNPISEFDAVTGAKIADVVALGTNPDWSPLGNVLAYSDKAGDSPAGANLMSVEYDGGVWGARHLVVAADGGTNLFPSYAPAGDWLAYVHGKGGHGDKTYQLWLAKADGTGRVELINANRVVGSQVTNGQFENNMPTWAPPGDFDWIAFNSLRPYGVVYPAGGTQQIWVAAIDRSKLGTTSSDGGLVDPSYPAFRFAFQALAENNHRAFWTLDVRVPDDAGTAPSCQDFGVACDPAAPNCCLGTTCQPNGELGGSVCLRPPDDAGTGGACIPEGAACSQTSGAACCGSQFCDVGLDGGVQCQLVIIQ